MAGTNQDAPSRNSTATTATLLNGGAPRGRPRSDKAHRAILDAAREQLIKEGYSGLRLEHVAAHAGVGKATIYRRWRSKEALAQALLADLAAPHIDIEETGDTREEMLAAVMNPMLAVTTAQERTAAAPSRLSRTAAQTRGRSQVNVSPTPSPAEPLSRRSTRSPQVGSRFTPAGGPLACVRATAGSKPCITGLRPDHSCDTRVRPRPQPSSGNCPVTSIRRDERGSSSVACRAHRRCPPGDPG